MREGLAIKYLSVALAAAVKFFAGPITGLALGLEWYETAICSAAGMMLAVVATTYIGKGVQVLIKRWRKEKPRRFSKSSRMAVRIWKRFGIIGIALLTPLLFTPIGGTFIAVAFRVHRQSIFLWMLISGVTVGTVLSYLVYSLKFVERWFTR
ncbi:hypothetical protein [Salmonirosea aquatica]|uniref:Small multi-drug export protein n=1 Tax=Salmonirosea aquatica TaxID=2654236 RepID=A0A7C9FCN7_9BACT|nr:hypothetical protein [Cytophagaceae bacterium SJW1-29]